MRASMAAWVLARDSSALEIVVTPPTTTGVRPMKPRMPWRYGVKKSYGVPTAVPAG